MRGSALRTGSQQRASSSQRSGSASRAAPRPSAGVGPGSRPPSRSPGGFSAADHRASPVNSDSGDPRSAAVRRGTSPGLEAQRRANHAKAPGLPTPCSASRAGSGLRASSQGRAPPVGHSAAAGRGAPPAAAPGGGASDITRSAVHAYLKVYGLNQYARAFTELGLGDLEAIGRLSETEALEFLERLRIFPGHRLRLLRAIDCLRHATVGADRRDAAQLLEDDAALERLSAQNEELSKEKKDAADENHKLQEENQRLIEAVRQQDGQLKKARERIQELEELVQAQTEQVGFLMQQLQNIASAGPEKTDALYRSYRDSYDDWSEAERINLPEAATLQPGKGVQDDSHARAITPEDLQRAVSAVAEVHSRTVAPNSAPVRSSQGVAMARLAAADAARGGGRIPTGTTPFSPPRRAKLAQSLDMAQVKECLAGFDVDHIIRCLATALQNKIILSVARSRPHTASADCIRACGIFMEPACKHRLETDAAAALAQQQKKMQILSAASPGTEGATPLSSFCSPLMNRDATATSPCLLDTMGKPVEPLNGIAVRSVPNKWDIYGFLRDVMVNFRLEPEVSVVTLNYVDRFSDLCGVALTPDNWQRLIITSMMLASKVWNDESFENIEFAQLCPLYTLDEINTFERVFLKCVGYNMSVKGSDYAKTYFLLRTLGAKDSADFGLEPINDKRALRLAERCLEKQMEFRERYPEDAVNSAMNWTM